MSEHLRNSIYKQQIIFSRFDVERDRRSVIKEKELKDLASKFVHDFDNPENEFSLLQVIIVFIFTFFIFVFFNILTLIWIDLLC